VVNGVNGTVGPQLVTQDFGSRIGGTPLVTGVAYYDLDGDGFYDLGEGIGGATVSISGAGYYAVTAGSGGYAVPVAANGSYAVVFTAPNLNTQRVGVVSSLANVKVDLPLVYPAPALTGPGPAWLNQTNQYVCTPVPGATAYELEMARLLPFVGEGAENGLAGVTTNSTGTYPVRVSDIKSDGGYGFHLAHDTFDSQSVTLNPQLLLGTNSQLSFAKRLGLAAYVQVARAQISTNNGASWINLWSQPGSGDSGETSFTTVTVPLPAYAGRVARLRFVYDVSGSYYVGADPGIGFYFDSIAISGANEVATPLTNSSTGTTLAFVPANTGNWRLRARPVVNNRRFPWGPGLGVAVVAPPPTVRCAARPLIVGNSIQIEFDVTGYLPGMTFQLFKAATPSGSWSLDAAATLAVVTPNVRYRLTTTTGPGSMQYYKVKASW
jgi:hypothetical protein